MNGLKKEGKKKSIVLKAKVK